MIILIIILIILIFLALLIINNKELFNSCTKVDYKKIIVYSIDWNWKYNGQILNNYVDYNFFNNMVIRGLNDYTNFKDKDKDKKIRYVLTNFINPDFRNNLFNYYNNYPNDNYPNLKKIIDDKEINKFVNNNLNKLKNLLRKNSPSRSEKKFIHFMIKQMFEYKEKKNNEENPNNDNIQIVLLPYLYNDNEVIKITDKLYVIGLYKLSTQTKTISFLPLNKLPKYWITNYYNSKVISPIEPISQNNIKINQYIYNNLISVLNEINRNNEETQNKIDKRKNKLQILYSKYAEINNFKKKYKYKYKINEEDINNINNINTISLKKIINKIKKLNTYIKDKQNSIKETTESNLKKNQIIINYNENNQNNENNENKINTLFDLKTQIKKLKKQINDEINNKINDKKKSCSETKIEEIQNEYVNKSLIYSEMYINKIDIIEKLYTELNNKSQISLSSSLPCINNNNICNKSKKYIDIDSPTPTTTPFNFKDDLIYGDKNSDINKYIYSYKTRDYKNTLDPNYSYI